jgi:glycosyltransferase involved in cell wall biosynthesis
MTTPDLLIDVTRLIWRRWAGRYPTGIDRVSREYVLHYQVRAQAVIQYPRFRRILSPQLSSELFALLLDDRAGFRRRLTCFAAMHLFAARRSWPSLGRLYLNVGHTGLDHPGHAEWTNKTGVRPIYLVHDLIPITHPQYCRDGEQQRHVRRITTVLNAACAVISNSNDTHLILSDFAAGSNLPMPTATFAFLGTAAMPLRNNSATPLATPYYVILGTIEGRKNHSLLLRIWQQMVKSGATNIPQLIIIGQRGWQCDDVTRQLDSGDALNRYVTEISDCDDDTIALYLRGARALLFPSYAEGYGMPLMEALMAGTPVIASNLAVFQEIAGNVPEFLAPDDLVGWLDMITLYSANPSPERNQQLSRMSKLKLPTWQDHFRKIDTLIESLPT